MKDRTGEVWDVWSGPMVIIGPPTGYNDYFVEHPCLNLERGTLFTYAENRDSGGFEESFMCERIC